MTITVTNPWHDAARISNSKPVLSYEGRCLLSHRGVEVYKNPAGSWDYVYEGMAITQRAGINKGRACDIIDGILSMSDESMDWMLTSRAVQAHIKESA